MKPFGAAIVPAILVFVACDTPGVRLIDPEVVSDPLTGVTFQVQLEDSVMAQTLGWANGVPGAYVILQRVAEPYAPDTLLTDAIGEAFYPNFLPGQYKVAAHRVLSHEEAEPTGGTVRAFGDGWIRNIHRGADVPLELTADKSGSLVFSEWCPAAVAGAGIDSYQYARYLELYNNSDTTIFIDGVLLGRAWPTVSETTILSCSDSELWRNDPAGLWSLSMHMFPGSGHEYPVAPGEAVTVAMDGVDHSLVDPGLPDLSDADFEFEGTVDADNPDVPNMPYLTTGGPTTHGLHLFGGTFFVALPADFESLHRRSSPYGYDFVRIPTEKLLDVARMAPAFAYSTEMINPPCGLVAPRNLERLQGGEFTEYWEDVFVAAHRRILRTSAGDRIVLQDVNTSFVDFIRGDRNPGTIEW